MGIGPRGATGAGSSCLARPVAMKNSLPFSAVYSLARCRLSAEQYPASARICFGAYPVFAAACSVIGIRFATSAAQSPTSVATMT